MKKKKTIQTLIKFKNSIGTYEGYVLGRIQGIGETLLTLDNLLDENIKLSMFMRDSKIYDHGIIFHFNTTENEYLLFVKICMSLFPSLDIIYDYKEE